MNRLTSNKNVSDMSMIELAHNSCYKDSKRNARYRDYELDIDSRQLVRNLVKNICDEDLTDLSDEEFDEYMGSMLSVEVDSGIGLLALFYRNLWVMADLREQLKEYEDLEEQGRLIKWPCKVGMSDVPIGAYTYSDSYLRHLRKDELIEHYRTLENNWFNEIIALNNQAESCKKLLKEERNKAIDDFYNKLLEASESAKPVGWPTMQEIVQMVYIKDIVEELKAGE